MIDATIQKMVVERFGSPLIYPQQCEALAADILSATGQSLGVTTLKRMFGFVKGAASPRRASLDIVAVYLGYEDFKQLRNEIGYDIDISDFDDFDSLTSDDLEPGERVRISYEPSRCLTLEYLGDNLYNVVTAEGSKLQAGDRLLIAGFYVGFELLISNVERQGTHLGPYRAAKRGGLTEVVII